MMLHQDPHIREIRSAAPSICAPSAAAPTLSAGLLLAALLGPGVLAAQQAEEAAAPPAIEVVEPHKEAGRYMVGGPVFQTFQFRNTGGEFLELEPDGSSCGSKIAALDRRVRPGGKGKAIIELDTKTLGAGPRTLNAWIETNDPERPRVNLQLYVELDELGYPIPKKVLMRDVARKVPLLFLVRAHESNPFEITDVTSDLEWLSFSWRELDGPVPPIHPLARYRPRKGDYEVKVRAAPDAPEGRVLGLIRVHTTSDRTAEISLPVDGYLSPPELAASQ